MALSSRPEPLESRIAPAQFFLSGTSLTVEDAAGADVNDAALASDATADLAVVLKKGDTLVLDTNGNHLLDASETVFAKLSGGSAAFFITDLDADTKVGADEITGIAAGSGFNATIDGDVNGDIATTLAADATFAPETILSASIAGAKISGRVTGSILAGGSISNVTIGPSTASAQPSVTDIRTGTQAANQTISYNGGTETFATAFTQPGPGAAGGSISKITLAGGATNIRTGDGADNPNGPGGKGGSISAVTMLDSAGEFIIVPGDGGDSTKVGSKGGDGGSASAIKITSSQTAADGTQSYIGAGLGGQGDTGGRGGSASNGTVHFTAATGVSLYIYGRDGGAGGVAGGKVGSGGAGGSVSKFTLTADSTLGFAGFYGGDGGSAAAGSNGKGGAGGSVSKIGYEALGGIYAPDFEGGNGGSGQGKGAGGNGGNVSALTIDQGNTDKGQEIFGGAGGAATNGKGGAGGAISSVTQTAGTLGLYLHVRGGVGGMSVGGAGGSGGSLSKWTLTAGNIGGNFEAFAGAGGGSTGGKGGAGGALKSVTATLANVAGGSAIFTSGRGGSGGAPGGDAGGVASKVTVTLGGHVGSFLGIYSGAGGSAIAGDGRGGKAGGLSTVTVMKSAGSPDSITISSGNGGDGSGKGTAGSGGAASRITFHGAVPTHALYIGSGSGGDSPGDGARGGNGGKLSTVTLDVPAAAAFSETATLYGGNGGAAIGAEGKGGDGGSLNAIKLDALMSLVRINNGPNHGDPHAGDGGTGLKSAGGDGGSVSGVTGRVGLLLVNGQRGGSAETTGGDGGGLKSLNLSEVSQFVQLIAGGVGGDSGADGTPGRGGNVAAVNVPGDIGNFSAAFNLDPLAIPGAPTPGMGGLVAGLAGSLGGAESDPTRNGTVSSITATRIAAILAGNVSVPGGVFDGTTADRLTESNAVRKLTKIRASVLGADAVAPAGFDFIDNAATSNGVFALGEGDTARDGLVIVLGTTTVLPVEPLRFEEVVLVV